MVITSRKNDAVKRFRELLREKSARDAQGVFAVEGDHLCGELAKSGYGIISVLTTERAEEKYPQTAALLRQKCSDVTVISGDVAEYISDTKAPQGLFAIAEKPVSPGIGGARRLVLLDGVQDPGNVGTIIRAAEALGFGGAVLSPDCADIWAPKTLRASMGSVLRLTCVIGSMQEQVRALRADGFSVYGAMLDKSAARLGEIEFPERAAVVIGSEGRGVSPDVAAECTRAVYIPISGAESLNAAAAAAIILWELSK